MTRQKSTIRDFKVTESLKKQVQRWRCCTYIVVRRHRFGSFPEEVAKGRRLHVQKIFDDTKVATRGSHLEVEPQQPVLNKLTPFLFESPWGEEMLL